MNRPNKGVVLSVKKIYTRMEETLIRTRYHDARGAAFALSSKSSDELKPMFFPSDGRMSDEEIEFLVRRFLGRNWPVKCEAHRREAIASAVEYSDKINPDMNVVRRIEKEKMLDIICLVDSLRTEAGKETCDASSLVKAALLVAIPRIQNMRPDETDADVIPRIIAAAHQLLYRAELRVSPQTYALGDRWALHRLLEIVKNVRRDLHDERVIQTINATEVGDLHASDEFWMYLVQYPDFDPSNRLSEASAYGALHVYKSAAKRDPRVDMRKSIDLIESWLGWKK